MHDYWYDSGFNEAGKNAQRDNYGRMGVGGDPLHAEAQDSAESGQGNNANMSTFADGVLAADADVRVERPPQPHAHDDAHAFAHLPRRARRGELRPQTFDVNPAMAPLMANDGTAPSNTDACEPLTNTVTGRIVIVDSRHLPIHREGGQRAGCRRRRHHHRQQRGWAQRR
jgi:hypothetical protein